MLSVLSQILRYRYFIWSSIKTEFRVRFLRSRLGGFWMFLNPLAQVLMFVFVLSAAMTARLPGLHNRYSYALYLMAGTLAWSLFAEIVNRCLTLFIDNSHILKKLSFPRITLPLIVVGSAIINNLLLFAAILIIFYLLGQLPGSALWWLPALMLVNILLALGVGLMLGIVNVFIRDIGQVVPVAMQFLFWLTPIVYMMDIIPPQYLSWLKLNPLVPIVNSYQQILLYNQAPEGHAFILVVALILFFLSLSFMLYRKASPELVDVL